MSLTMVLVLCCAIVFSFFCLAYAQSYNCGTSAGPLVTHGRPVSLGEYPWLAALYQLDEEGKWSQFCGGALISPRVVLTAAHCLVFERTLMKPETIKVGLGKLFRDFYHNENYATIANVSQVVAHPRFYGALSRYALDVGLLKLSIVVEISYHILPVCIDLDTTVAISNGAPVHAAGWGTSENGTSTERALAADLSYLDNYACLVQSPLHYGSYITNDKFCALSINGSQVDKGDSGGALSFSKNDRHFVLGVVSTKVKTETSFSIFTDLSNVEIRSWLKKETATLNSSLDLKCGVSAQPLSDDPNQDGRVTHGQFPWIAPIYTYRNERWRFECSGILISTHIVLTESFCVFDTFENAKVKPEHIKVGLGKYYKPLDRNESHSIMADVREVVIYSTQFYMALLDLAVHVKPTPYIKPACLLWEATTNINLDGKGYLAGYIATGDETRSWQVSFSSLPACKKKVWSVDGYYYLFQGRMCVERISGRKLESAVRGAALTAYVQGAHYVVGVLSIIVVTTNNTIYLVTDLKNERHVNWLRSVKSRLDKLH